jgi:hypothetical protein
MTETARKQMNDPEIHKGAIESDRPSEETNVENKGKGVDKEGLPDDPIAQAQDKEGANADQSQG